MVLGWKPRSCLVALPRVPVPEECSHEGRARRQQPGHGQGRGSAWMWPRCPALAQAQGKRVGRPPGRLRSSREATEPFLAQARPATSRV